MKKTEEKMFERILNQTKRNYTNSISNYNNCYAYFNRNFYKCYYR